jgi:hypothetical protein
MLVVALAGCGSRTKERPAPEPTSLADTADKIEKADGSGAAVDPVAEPVSAGPPARVTPRMRAAYGMLLDLRSYARTMLEMEATRKQFTRGGCPTGIEWVTWGMAKTDPWDTQFALRCTPGPAASTEIGSAGPDRKLGTPDDLWSDRPLVLPGTACKAACRHAEACSTTKLKRELEEVRRAACDDACASRGDNQPFYAETCTLLESCDAAVSCLDSALAGKGYVPFADCQAFGAAGAKALAKPGIAKALTEECEKDALDVHELVCVQAATTPKDLSLCFLTVNRANVEDIASGS